MMIRNAKMMLLRDEGKVKQVLNTYSFTKKIIHTCALNFCQMLFVNVSRAWVLLCVVLMLKQSTPTIKVAS